MNMTERLMTEEEAKEINGLMAVRPVEGDDPASKLRREVCTMGGCPEGAECFCEQISDRDSYIEYQATELEGLRKGEIAWLIETGDHNYWNGRKANSDGFTHDPNDAVRFARFEDSERVIHWLMQEWSVFLVSRQHSWMNGDMQASPPKPMKLHFTNEWLKTKIEQDGDDFPETVP